MSELFFAHRWILWTLAPIFVLWVLAFVLLPLQDLLLEPAGVVGALAARGEGDFLVDARQPFLVRHGRRERAPARPPQAEPGHGLDGRPGGDQQGDRESYALAGSHG